MIIDVVTEKYRLFLYYRKELPNILFSFQQKATCLYILLSELQLFFHLALEPIKNFQISLTTSTRETYI